MLATAASVEHDSFRPFVARKELMRYTSPLQCGAMGDRCCPKPWSRRWRAVSPLPCERSEGPGVDELVAKKESGMLVGGRRQWRSM